MHSPNAARVDDAFAAPPASPSSLALQTALKTYTPDGPDVFVDEFIAAEYLGRAVRTMRNDRYRGGGPLFRKFGCSVRYSMRDLIAYASRSYGSTAQVPRFVRKVDRSDNHPSQI